MSLSHPSHVNVLISFFWSHLILFLLHVSKKSGGIWRHFFRRNQTKYLNYLRAGLPSGAARGNYASFEGSRCCYAWRIIRCCVPILFQVSENSEFPHSVIIVAFSEKKKVRGVIFEDFWLAHFYRGVHVYCSDIWPVFFSVIIMAQSGLWRAAVDSTGVSDTSSGSERNLRVRKKTLPAVEVDLVHKHSRILRDGSRVLICPHCPFAIKSPKRFLHHFKHHRIGTKEDVQPPSELPASAKKRNGERQPVTCPFCSYQSFSHVTSFKHAQMHFNFKHFLAIRGLEVRYERHWSKCDTVEMHIRAHQEDGTSNRADSIEEEEAVANQS